MFFENVCAIPGGERIRNCIQCGTCSASCPTSYAMDYPPRQVIAWFRAGMLDKVLKSNTMWMCVSCYYCTVRCPANIKFTDIMYELKRLGIEYGLMDRKAATPVLSKTFVDIVDKYGRNAEFALMSRFLAKTNPLGMLKSIPMGVRMFLRGRLKVFPSKIKGMKQLQAMSEWLKKGDRD